MQDIEAIRPYVEFTRPYLEFAAVVTGAISGALHAKRRSFDFVGVVIIGISSGLGGGIIRDVLLGRGPVLALQSSAVLIAAIVASLIGVMYGSVFIWMRPFNWTLDSLTLGLFAVAGLQRAAAAGLSNTPSIFLGTVTCVGGGLVRDVLCRETPELLLPGEPYAVIAVIAGVIYVSALRALHLAPLTAELLAVGSAVGLRAAAAWRQWETHVPPDLAE
jgi:uncharacterized membrane protein YeiH